MMKTDFVVTKDGAKIFFDHYQNGFRQLIIIAHGFFNSRDTILLKDLANDLKVNYDVMVMDFRGHGKSSGLFHWTSKEYLDLLAVLDYAHTTYEKIGVIGFSLGGSTSIIAASKTNLMNSLVCVSAPSDFQKIDYRLWELDPENDLVYSWFGQGHIGKGVHPGPWWQKKERPMDIVSKLTLPICYIHGDQDWVVKQRHSKELYDQTRSFKKFMMIKKGPHAEYLMRRHREELVNAIKEWFKETL